MSDEEMVTSDTGGAKGRKLARWDMIPMDSLTELAEHFGRGAEKYPAVNGKDNWRNGYDWSLSIAAAFRHLAAHAGGEDLDPGTGSKHLIAAAWHCLTQAHHMNNPAMKRFDDRQDPKDRLAEWERELYMLAEEKP